MVVSIKLLFSKERTKNDIIAKLIQWWTSSDFYHVEMMMGNIWIRSHFNQGGVSIVTDKEPTFSDFTCHEFSVELTKRQHDDLLIWLRSKHASRYDFLGILLSTIIPARIDDPNRWFCSELVTKILQLLLVDKTYDLTPNMITPGHLARLFGVK